MHAVDTYVEGVPAGDGKNESVHVEHVRHQHRSPYSARAGGQVHLAVDPYHFLTVRRLQGDADLVTADLLEPGREAQHEAESWVTRGKRRRRQAVEDAQDVELAGPVDGGGVREQGEVDLHALSYSVSGERASKAPTTPAALAGGRSFSPSTMPARRSMTACATMAGTMLPDARKPHAST